MFAKRFIQRGGLLLLLGSIHTVPEADEFDQFLKPFFTKNCVKCHGGEKVKGKVNLKEIANDKQFLANPELIKELIEVIDAADMPPEDEPRLTEAQRANLLASLKTELRAATANAKGGHIPIRRLNRFQYNNTVRDLFQLNRDVFPLPEKLMTRQTIYLNAPKMPDRVNVRSLTLNPADGLREVKAFPKDLRASHGFDNQANQLTLSPLLLDAFLRLSVSIVESPDFNENTVGVWNTFFKPPAEGIDLSADTRKRIAAFLKRAFRGPVEAATVDRYTAYALAKMKQELTFTESMKKVASGVLSSPMFLYRYPATDAKAYTLASNLSFFLWASTPDSDLLRLAGNGDLVEPEVLDKTIDRMLADPKIERFLDTFPAQWMQLENILAATPDPKKHRLFMLDKNHPASLQMLCEPLLLFDAVFVEDRPIAEFIKPTFSYQSDFLKDWYTTDLKAPKVDEKKIIEENKPLEAKRKAAREVIKLAQYDLDVFVESIPSIIEKKADQIDFTEGQAQWEAAQQKALAESAALSPWHHIGPFGAGNFDEAHAKAFIDETNVNLGKTYGKLKWEFAKNFVDGKVHALNGGNSATYLYRTIQSGTARELELSIGTDDSFKLWLNGKLITDKKITRGVAPDQDKVRVSLVKGQNKLLFKIANGGGGYGFYFKTQSVPFPVPVVAAIQTDTAERSDEQTAALAEYYLSIAPELEPARKKAASKREILAKVLNQEKDKLNKLPKPRDPRKVQEEMNRRYDDEIRGRLRDETFRRVAAKDPRYGGVITSAAMLSMTSGPRRTHPIARGAWVIEVIFNDPPPPPPNDVPPLNEDASDENLTIREKFAEHRENPDCAGCHSRLDPLGFALENFDITGRWRDKYENGRTVDVSGTLLRKYEFKDIVRFKESIAKEDRRFAKAFTAHLMRFALSRELTPGDTLTIDRIINKTANKNFRLRSLLKEVIRSKSFLQKS
ncbi:MAG: DUF1588 domain-containing protein [Verrucomicrobia bacterium]|nr:DUF1588 domain-containing protein [Verrucomicrobiota bacterium]